MTNATAHTPGSWGVLETCHEARPWNVTDEQDCTVAMVVQNPLDDQNTSRANARLIAAAPDLLWLVERAATLRTLPKEAKWTKAETERSWAHWDELARAAITKAEGRP